MGPFYNHDIIQVEKVQRRATHLVSSLRHLPYIGRLSALNPPSLTYRRKRHDMIYLFQLMQGRVDINISYLFTRATFSSTRCHNYTSYSSHMQSSCLSCFRFFAICSINDWNALPENIINASTIFHFKQFLNLHWIYVYTDFNY